MPAVVRYLTLPTDGTRTTAARARPAAPPTTARTIDPRLVLLLVLAAALAVRPAFPLRPWRPVLRLDPKNCLAATNLGVALEQNGKVDEARQQWTHALEVDPTCESARRALSKPR
jgi:Flp pilus assembly protein TadD